MRAAEPGRRPIGRWSGRPLDEPARGLVRLVTRLVVAQAIASAAIGLPFSRRQLPSILITLLPASWQDTAGRYLPMNAGEVIYTVQHQPHTLPPWPGLGVFCLYAAAVLVAGFVLIGRRDA